MNNLPIVDTVSTITNGDITSKVQRIADPVTGVISIVRTETKVTIHPIADYDKVMQMHYDSCSNKVSLTETETL